MDYLAPYSYKSRGNDGSRKRSKVVSIYIYESDEIYFSFRIVNLERNWILFTNPFGMSIYGIRIDRPTNYGILL